MFRLPDVGFRLALIFLPGLALAFALPAARAQAPAAAKPAVAVPVATATAVAAPSAGAGPGARPSELRSPGAPAAGQHSPAAEGLAVQKIQPSPHKHHRLWVGVAIAGGAVTTMVLIWHYHRSRCVNVAPGNGTAGVLCS